MIYFLCTLWFKYSVRNDLSRFNLFWAFFHACFLWKFMLNMWGVNCHSGKMYLYSSSTLSLFVYFTKKFLKYFIKITFILRKILNWSYMSTSWEKRIICWSYMSTSVWKGWKWLKALVNDIPIKICFNAPSFFSLALSED